MSDITLGETAARVSELEIELAGAQRAFGEILGAIVRAGKIDKSELSYRLDAVLKDLPIDHEDPIIAAAGIVAVELASAIEG